MIKLRTLNLEPLNILNGDGHILLRRRLNEDISVYDYVSRHFSEWTKEPINSDSYEIGNGKAYVISDDSKKIGMLGSTKFSSDGVIDLWVALDREYRGYGYGEKVLIQMTQYFVENLNHLSDIQLVINKSNLISLKTAKACGYNLVDKYDDKLVYQYFKK